MRIPSGNTTSYVYFVAVDATDFTTRETGLTGFTVYRSRNGGAAAAMTTPTINEVDATNMPGVYELLLDEDMTIGSGNDSEEMVFQISVAGMAPVTRTIELYRPKITVGETLSTADIASILEDTGTTLPATLATIDGEVGDILTDTGTTIPAQISALNDPTAGAIADAVWTESLSAHSGVSGSTAEALAAAGSAGDPWITSLPGSYTGTQAGKILADVLVDTGTDIPASIAALNDLDAAGVRAAVGLATANLDTQLGNIDTVVDAILADTGTDGVVISATTANQIADAILKRDFSAVSGESARSAINALRFLRNKWSTSGATLTVTKEDDTTAAWTATLSTNASAEPVTGSDPA